MQRGDRIGPWLLDSPLGGGGNAKVWLARRDDGATVALKVITITRARTAVYRYDRFRDEVMTLQRFQGHPGILPLVDASLPAKLTRSEPPWLAMPVAELSRRALSKSTVDEVVAAVATYSRTLAELAEAGVFHRDLKPDNLYWYDGRWVIGDFGLGRVPALL